MKDNEFEINGVKMTIINKTRFEMAGFKKAVKLGDGSISLFIKELDDSGRLKKLAGTLSSPQQIWVCLSDCQSCGRGCSDFHTCCRVCVEKTEKHDFSGFEKGEISMFAVEASEWVVYETKNKAATDYLHKTGIYELVQRIGYKWNENIRLHFDNEHECFCRGEWVEGKIYRFLLPVVPF